VNTSGSGLIGLHRPYFASSPQQRETTEREAPLMMQSLKRYVEEMGVTDNFYRVMVNTEPSDMVLYGNREKGHKDIYSIVPSNDPTYDEVEASYDARWHGVSTSEMRARESDTGSCFLRPIDEHLDCIQAKEWGLSESVYIERWKQTKQCYPDIENQNRELNSVKRKTRRDHPIWLRREACVQKIMLGR
jgi:hypothetical protein